MAYDPKKYGPVFASLLALKDAPTLAYGRQDIFRQSQIVGNTLEALFLHKHIMDFDMARSCHAGIMILNNFPDQAHQVLNRIKSPTGNYWQGILFRRRLDKTSSENYFGKIENHPIYDQMLKVSRQLSAKVAGCYLQSHPIWDPVKFTDYCIEQNESGSEAETLCRTLVLAEIRLLFDYSYEHAVE
ncbi:MAG: hypothetical protein JW739_06695 [Opitutales bacterium]|nr:hypothetical protein [Opitutales bacterium]